MKKQSIYKIIISVVILVLVVVYFVVKMPINSDKDATNETNTDQVVEPMEIIHVKHQYKNGIHTFAGDLIVDNDCSTGLNSKVEDTEDGPLLVFETVKALADTPCTREAFKTYPFKLFHTSSEDTAYSATVNGTPVRLNLYEISPDEDIDEVDLFIKG